jgi:hypothetical protein
VEAGDVHELLRWRLEGLLRRAIERGGALPGLVAHGVLLCFRVS